MILVTGATGLVGRAVAHALVANGQNVRLHARNHDSLCHLFSEKSEIEFASLDLETATRADYRKLVQGCRGIVHAAALVHKPNSDKNAYERLNIEPTRLLAGAAQLEGTSHFIFLSTSAVYGSGPFENVDENAQTNPDTLYGQSKLSCERLLSELSPCSSTLVLRPSLVFGEGDRGNMLSLIKQVRRKMYFHIGAGDTRKSLIYSGDIARAIVLLLERGPTGFEIFNIANESAPTVRNIAESIAEASGQSTSILALPPPVVNVVASAASAFLGRRSPLTPDKVAKLRCPTTVCVNKLRQVVGFQSSYSLVDGIKKEIAWANSNKLI